MRGIVYWTVICALCLIIWRRPIWGVISYAAFNIVRPEMFFWGGSTGGKTFLVVFSVTILATIINNTNKIFTLRIPNRFNLYLFLWVYLALLLSTLFSQYDVNMGSYSQNQYSYLNELFKNFILCCLVTIYINNLDDVFSVERILLGVILFLGVWGIQQYFLGNYRLEGIGGDSYMDSNGVAAMFVLFVPIALSFFFSHSKLDKIFGLVAFLVLVVAVVCTSSRGGAVGLVVALIVFIMRSKKRTKLFILGIILFLTLLPFVTDEYKERINTISDLNTIDYSGQSRLILWRTGLMIFRDNPILGVGFLSFKDAKMEYINAHDIDEPLRDYTFRPGKVGHSTYVQILAEGGLLATIPFFLLIFYTLFKNWKVRRECKGNSNLANTANLLSGLDSGIIGFCVCIIGIDALIDVLFPFQITICAIVRENILGKLNSPSKLQ